MDNLLRLLLRFVVVPLGYLAAVIAGAVVTLVGGWGLGEMALSNHPDAASYAVFGFLIAGPFLFVILLSVMWLPAAIGVLIAEAFAIRSWMFHVANGAVSAWLGWQLFTAFGMAGTPVNKPLAVIAAGLAAGFAYWAVAGWNAGFWKPVFARERAVVTHETPDPRPSLPPGSPG
jgi:hypothetical protein